MKKLILVRHGKAEDPVSGISDFERSLTPKGKVISRLMARKLRETEKSALTLITSPAFRAFETSLIFAGELGIDAEKVIVNSNIYYKMNMRHLTSILSAAKDSSDAIVLFGHNPSFTEIADTLSGEGCDFMPKSGVICISFKTGSWTDIKQKSGKIEYYFKPDKTL
jgi:phosphohistidine phosphatase